MPTAAKLVAAVLMAAVGYTVAAIIQPTLPDQVRADYIAPLSAFIGLIVGWRFLGPRVGRGLHNLPAFALTAGALLAFSSVLAFAFWQMIQRSFRLSYGGPFEALEDMVQIAVHDAREYLLATEPLFALLIGSVIATLVTELVAKVAK